MIRKAKTSDIKSVQKLVNDFAKEYMMIPRSLNDLYENIRDFIVNEENSRVNAACALHVVWEDLGEIRSLAVEKDAQGRGIGRELVRMALEEAKELGVNEVFTLTYNPDFFKQFGFTDIDKSKLPHKIWGDCINCHKFPECDEVALILR